MKVSSEGGVAFDATTQLLLKLTLAPINGL